MVRKKKTNKEYTIDSIKDLTEKEYLRLKPSMTFGHETGDEDYPYSSMKLTLIREIVDNAVGEATQGFADTVKITFNEDGSFTVLDNGRGLPVDTGTTAEGKKVSGIYKTMAMLKSGGNLDSSDYKFTPSAHGVGAASSILMTEYATIKVYRNKKIYELHFWDGDPGFFKDPENPSAETFTPLGKDLTKLIERKDDRPAALKKAFPTGSEFTLKINDSLFTAPYDFSKEDLIERMRGTSALVKGINIDIIDETNGNEEHFKYQNGIVDLLELSQAQEPISEPIYVSGEVEFAPRGKNVNKQKKLATYEIIFGWQPSFDYHVESYVNTVRTRLGGVHEAAFQRALVDAMNEKFRSMRGVLMKKDEDPIFDDYAEGLSVIINTYVQGPDFTGQSKEELSDVSLRKALQDSIKEDLDKYIGQQKNYDNLKTIGEKIVAASRNRTKAREQRDLERQKKAITKSSRMPDKLIDCEITHDPRSEIIIAEGNSAAGSIKSSRDSRYQAVLPIRGKIINVLKSSDSSILANKEISDIIKALDSGIKDDCKVENARYQNICIAADADPDGYAISALLIAMIWKLFPDYLRKGRVFNINTPLFMIKIGTERYYAMNEEEKDDIIKKHGKNKRVEITRAKGLGELPADVMHQFGLNPETRVLTQIRIESEEEALEMLETTLGKDVGIRKQWIEDNPLENVGD